MAMPGRSGIITCNIEDVEKLYLSYLPFIKNGALFIPSTRQQQLGDDIFVAITLPGSSERMPLNGQVVWVNHRAQSNRPAGFAVQLSQDVSGLKLKHEIERLLAGKIGSPQPTYTM